MKFTCTKKRLRIVIEPETPELRNSAGQLIQQFRPPIIARFEEGENNLGYFDTDSKSYVWNQTANVIKGLGNPKLKERVENAIRNSNGWKRGWIKEWTKPKMVKLVEVENIEEADVLLDQNATIPTEEMLESDAKRVLTQLKQGVE